MNETNILAGVPVLATGYTFEDVYKAQLALQTRLNQVPKEFDNKHIAAKCIYWGHCIKAESEELLDWLLQKDDPTWQKEAQMEAIDIVHFLLNISIEIGLPASVFIKAEATYEHNEWDIEDDRIRTGIILLNAMVVELVDCFPWKTWKTYTTEPVLNDIIMVYTHMVQATLMICNATGLGRQEIVDMYFAKNKVNHERQDNGY